ncbi:hypothetical protein [Dactylosporangium sp. NPDC051484]|uniref:hypothetical protein n=1 Tax=Dactylosporangium sp. NPDC051484 TaxID=3154942 RepID=UPI00344C744C
MSADAAVTVAQRYARGAVVAAVVIAACWHLGFDLPSLVSQWTVYRWPVLAAVAWTVYTVIGLVGAMMLLRGPGSAALARVLAVCTLLVAIAVLVSTPGAATHSPANWATGSVGWLLVLTLWRCRPRELLATQAVNALLMLAAMAAESALDRMSFARYLMVIFGAVTLQLGYSISTHSFDAAARWAAANSAARASAMALQAATEAAALTRAERYRAVRRDSVAVLSDLADGADPADSAVRRSASASAARLRRLMAETDDVPAPLLHEMRACADIAERRGALVSLSVIGVLPVPPVAVRRALTDPAVEALSGARTAARLTVVGTDCSVIVSVVADSPDVVAASSHPDVLFTTHREGGRLWIETRWHGR